MKITNQSREIDRVFALDNPTEPYLLVQGAILKEMVSTNPPQGHISLEGCLEDNSNEMRIKWDDKATLVEEKFEGAWRIIPGIQKLTVTFDINSELPVVTLERFIP